MLKSMREGGAYFIKGVMLIVVLAFIGTIFVVWGVKSTPGGMAERGVVATVAGTDISQEEYHRAYRQRVEMYRQVFGDKLDEKLLDSINLKQQVLDQLIRRALLLDYADRNGITVRPEELAAEIQRMPVFAGKDGFSRQRYLNLLHANGLTPERFERDFRQDLTERKVESLIRDSAKVSDAEAQEQFRRQRRQISVEVVQLPAGDDGKKEADAITLATGKGKSLVEAAKDVKATVRTLGPFVATSPPADIPDPEAFRAAVSSLAVGETSPLVPGQKASYLVRLVAQADPPAADFAKEKETFKAQLLNAKQQLVFADWLQQLRKEAKVSVNLESL